MIHQTNDGSHLRITKYIKANEMRQFKIETYKCPICGSLNTRTITERKIYEK